MKPESSNTFDRDQIIELLRTFKNENAEKYGIESMALFGSVARGEHNENSDVDLLIKFKSPSLYLYAELADALETILGIKVDIVSASAKKRPGFLDKSIHQFHFVLYNLPVRP